VTAPLNPLAGIDPSALIQGLGAIAVAAAPAIGVLLFVVGMFFVARSGYLMWRGREGRGVHDDVPFGAVVANLFAGAALMQLNKTISNTRETLGGAGGEVRAAMQYMASGAGSAAPIYQMALGAAFAWLALIGICAVVRGLLMWRELAAGGNRGGGDNMAWGGFWHIVGGGICVNIGMG
jgi:hypothetical protein